jgi:DNA-binding NarL/FixJ family response regulator
MVSQRSALVVARPSPLRDGLAALLWSIPGLHAIYQVDNASSALLALTRYRPALILVDADLPEEDVWLLLEQLKLLWPQTRCVVLTDTVWPTLQSEAASAYEVLLKGYPAAKLSTVLEQLL